MSREKGDILEEFVLETWPERLRKEPNSGATNNQNDLRGDYSSIECKRKLQSRGLSLTPREIARCIDRARRLGRTPIWVSENSSERFVTMRYSDFVNLLEELF